MVRAAGLTGVAGWKAWCKEGGRPRNVPSNPHTAYKDDGWQGYGHWLSAGATRPGANTGTNARTRQPAGAGTTPQPPPFPFAVALRAARALRLDPPTEDRWRAWRSSAAQPDTAPDTTPDTAPGQTRAPNLQALAAPDRTYARSGWASDDAAYPQPQGGGV